MGDFLVKVGTLEPVDENNSAASGDGRSASAVAPVGHSHEANEAQVATAPASERGASCGGARSHAESTLNLGAGAGKRGDESGECADAAECSERGLCGEQSSESRDEGTCSVASIASSAADCSGSGSGPHPKADTSGRKRGSGGCVSEALENANEGAGPSSSSRAPPPQAPPTLPPGSAIACAPPAP